MKLGIFADPHYSSQEVTCQKRYNSRSLQKIAEAYAFFEQEQCDLIVCLGDLIDHECTREKVVENLKAIADVIHGTRIPTVCIMGNHDAFELTPDEFYAILKLEPTEELQLGSKNLLFLDTCYFSNGRHYEPGDSDWTDTYYPDTAHLKAKLSTLCGDTAIFLHQNIDPAIPQNHRLSNADSLLQAIHESRIVKAVIQGHYHHGCRSVHEGVEYITLPAMCENEGSFFIFEL